MVITCGMQVSCTGPTLTLMRPRRITRLNSVRMESLRSCMSSRLTCLRLVLSSCRCAEMHHTLNQLHDQHCVCRVQNDQTSERLITKVLTRHKPTQVARSKSSKRRLSLPSRRLCHSRARVPGAAKHNADSENEA